MRGGQGPQVPGPLPQNSLTTPRKAAVAADQAAAFVFDGAAAVGAGAHGGHSGCGRVHLGHAGQHLGDGVGAGQHLFAVLPVGAGAADAGDLLDDGVDLHPGAQGERYEAPGGLDLGAGAAPGLAHLGEDFAEAQVVLVHGDVELAAAGGD